MNGGSRRATRAPVLWQLPYWRIADDGTPDSAVIEVRE
jgi:hypothetical protein